VKLYRTTSQTVEPSGLRGDDGLDAPEIITHYTEFTSSESLASKTRTRLKKLGHTEIETVGVEFLSTVTGTIKFLNDLMAHPTWVVAEVTEKLGG
jgi:hypothetical protein